MKKTIIFFMLFMLMPVFSYAARFNCLEGKYNSIVVTAPPSHLSDSRGTATVRKGDGVCYIKLKTNKTVQEWEIKPDSLVQREIDSLSGRVLDEDTATRSGDDYLIDCDRSGCETGDADAYWRIFLQPTEGLNPFGIALLFYGHVIPDDPTSSIGLINKFVVVDTK